jgi:hypothetical protein
MAVDRVETLYHLTPRGWISGSVDSMWTNLNCTAEPPADRVETWKHKIYQSSGYSPEENSWFMVWSSPDVSEEERKALHEKFPHDVDEQAGYQRNSVEGIDRATCAGNAGFAHTSGARAGAVQ